MYELCKKCMYENGIDVCLRCFNYSSYKPKEEHLWPKTNPYLEDYRKEKEKNMISSKYIDDLMKKFMGREMDIIFDEIVVTCDSLDRKPVYTFKGHSFTDPSMVIECLKKGERAFTRTWANPVPPIEDVRFNGPATIVFWRDGTKTVVKAHDEDIDYEKGLAMAIAKKALGNKGNYFNEFKKWLPEEEKKEEPKPFANYEEATFEAKIEDSEAFKKLIGTTDDGKTFNISFEAARIVPVEEPKVEVSEKYWRYVHICKYRTSGYGNHGDDHTTIDEYCNYKDDCIDNRGNYCRGETCPRWNKEKDKNNGC